LGNLLKATNVLAPITLLQCFYKRAEQKARKV